jgi:GNAT superfamily N-acetyltransferase
MRRPRPRTADHPAGYPKTYEQTLRLDDGRRVWVRPVVPSDGPELSEAIRAADPATLHARFLGGAPKITDAVLDKLTHLDYSSRFALAAFAGGHGVAIARYTALPRTDDGTSPAEIAVAVAPEWRRAGLATALVALLARRAQDCAITHFTAVFFAQNLPVMELARAGNARVAIARGTAELEAPLFAPGDALTPRPDVDPVAPPTSEP